MFDFVTRVVHFFVNWSRNSSMRTALHHSWGKRSKKMQSKEQTTKPTKYAVIAGERVTLPVDAKFYFQDKRGLWFWSNRKPRVMDNDWTPNKSPVQVNNDEGYDRCLITPICDARKGAWRDSVMRTVNLENRPLAMSPEMDTFRLKTA
jgi:hypothetical protein